MAGFEEGDMGDFLSLVDSGFAAGGPFASSSTTGADGAGKTPHPPVNGLPPSAPHFAGLHSAAPGFGGFHPPPVAYAGHQPPPHPVAWPWPWMPWAPQACWGGSSQQYPSPLPPGSGGHGEGAVSGRGRGRVGRGRGRRGARKAVTTGTSDNAGNGDDRDTEDDNNDSDFESDNDSSAYSTADNGGLNGGGASDEDSADSGAPDPVEDALADLFGSDHEVIPALKVVLEQRKRKKKIMKQALLLGMYYCTYLEKNPPRVAKESGIEWVQRTLGNETSCYNMFRMHAPVFEMLHDVLVQSYGLKSTIRMSSREALGIFLWMVGPPEPVRQAEDKFTRSMETISRKFEHVLECVCNLAKDIIRPRDHTFSTVHPKIANHKYAPFFNNAIGAIDGTHVKAIVPGKKVGPYFNRSKEKSQNVLAICDFDKRFTFVAAGIPGSAHDWTVLQEAIHRYSDNFPHPPPGKFYLVDSGYPNRPGYMAPYKGVRYHQDDWKQAPQARGKKEIFNQAHSSIRSVIEQSFGVLKMKWRILLGLPHYSEHKQTQIILACFGLHNFILENDSDDEDFNMDEPYVTLPVSDEDFEGGEEPGAASEVEEDVNMNALRDEIAAACLLASRL